MDDPVPRLRTPAPARAPHVTRPEAGRLSHVAALRRSTAGHEACPRGPLDRAGATRCPHRRRSRSVPAAPTFATDFPDRAQTTLSPGIGAGALVAALPDLFFHQLGTRSHAAAALESS
ncbi:hypothetical protein [Streptomyces hypolithicus]